MMTMMFLYLCVIFATIFLIIYIEYLVNFNLLFNFKNCFVFLSSETRTSPILVLSLYTVCKKGATKFFNEINL